VLLADNLSTVFAKRLEHMFQTLYNPVESSTDINWRVEYRDENGRSRTRQIEQRDMEALRPILDALLENARTRAIQRESEVMFMIIDSIQNSVGNHGNRLKDLLKKNRRYQGGK
jgi:hypothetical protein